MHVSGMMSSWMILAAASWRCVRLPLHPWHTDIVHALLKAGADVDKAQADDFEETALYRASFEGHTDIVRALLDAGADVSAKDMLLKNLLPVTIGNAIAGAVAIGASFSYAFGRLGEGK